MADTYLILVRCMADDLPCMILDDKNDALAVAAALTPAKVWAIAKSAGFPTDCKPICVDVVTFRDRMPVESTTAQECINNRWNGSRPANVPPFIQWLSDNGLGQAEHVGGNSWIVRSDDCSRDE